MSSKKINTFANSKSPGSEGKKIRITGQAEIDELLDGFKKNIKYEHITVVGEGGMGKVTLSRDKNTLRKVAIKTLKKELLQNHEAIIRFTEEAQITAQLEHPNIIPVYEMGLDSDNAPFYTMKYVKGTNLKEILKLIKDKNEIILHKFHLTELLNIFVKICDAMSFACSKGVLHRDLKPENIMIGEFGEVLIVDWGLAKTFQLTVDTSVQSESFDENKLVKKINSFIEENIDTIRSLNNVSLSLDNCLIGTPQYMAPERIVGQGDEISEVFALGTILHDILALKHMFIAEEVKEVLQKIATGDYRKLEEYKNLPHIPGGRIPPALIAVVEKATMKNPKDRYESISELKSELESYILGFATKAERAGFFRLLKLGLARHKKLSSFVLLLLIALLFISGVFIYELVHSRQDALNKSEYANLQQVAAKRKSEEVIAISKELGKKVSELKSHSGIIYENAKEELQLLNFDKALDYTVKAIDLAPENPEYTLFHGKIMLSIMSFDEAVDSFRKIDSSSDFFSESVEYMNISSSLSAKVKNGSLSEIDYIHLYNFFKKKEEYDFAIAALKELQTNENYDSFLTEIWKLRLMQSSMSDAVTNSKTFIKAENGKFRININFPALFDLSPLEKMPIRVLNIINCNVNNIDVLNGMPLEHLTMVNTQVSNLTPLKGAPLVELRLRNNNISDISALEGMKLRVVSIINCPVENISPLKGMLIERLNIERTLVSNLFPLKGMQLKYLNANNTRVKNINGLKDMPLRSLLLNSSPVNNVDVLKHISPEIIEMNDTLITDIPEMNTKLLERISINDTSIKNLNFLKKARKLKEVMFSNTQVTNIEALRNHKIVKAELTGTAVSDISPVVNPELKELNITGSYVSDLSPLKSADRLEVLLAHNCGISDISSLAGLNMRHVNISGNSAVNSIESL
ncbi:MAG: serine/threonine protein kinase, partial [Lentisphaeraceae bacterium]|nr:serine/threonine protein kinase [Lentisphaeraceae bacterium]